MTREEAIKQMEEFMVIDDWSLVYLPDLHDALELAIEALTENESLAKSVIEASELLRKKRPHGEWKVYSHCSDGFSYKCSLCGRVVNEGHWFEQKEILSVYPYCHCGAKMVAVEDPIKWYFSLGKKENELDFKCIKVGNTIYIQDDDKQGWIGREENK